MTLQQYQAGTSFPILTNTAYNLDCVQGRYVPAVRNYLHKIQVTIDIQPNFIPQSLRQNDKIIMEMASEMQMTQKQQTRLKCIRMYLEITWLSEICSLNGKYIQPRILQKGLFVVAILPRGNSGCCW